MSRAGLETPLLGLLRRLEQHGDLEMPIGGLVGEDVERELDQRTAQSLVEEILVRCDPADRVERFWLARVLVDLDRRGGPEVQQLADRLAEELLRPFEEEQAGSTSPESLRSAMRLLERGQPISHEALSTLSHAFNGVVQVSTDPQQERVQMTGKGAELASLLIELTTGGSLHCDMSTHQELVGGVAQEVIKVEVDTCTYRSFDDCRTSIDPTRWPDANPFFQSVTILGTPTKSGSDWCGTIKEAVGPGINGQVYETDLDVTFVDRPGMVVTAFDLAKVRTDPGHVTVDRGFLSCTDEGAYRRIRTLKVYRIDNLSMPSSWICPLWSSQFALAAYWSGS